MLRQATYGTARIGLHTAFSEKLQELNGGNAIPFYQKFISSFLSGAIASSIGNPFDVAVSVPASQMCQGSNLHPWRLLQPRLTRAVATCSWCASRPIQRSQLPSGTAIRASAMR